MTGGHTLEHGAPASCVSRSHGWLVPGGEVRSATHEPAMEMRRSNGVGEVSAGGITGGCGEKTGWAVLETRRGWDAIWAVRFKLN